MSLVTFYLSHVTCYMWNAYVDPLDMLNNFCFLVYAQKLVFVIMSHFACRMSHCLYQMSHCAFHMSCVKCLCWSLVHSEQLLFSCVSSKVIIYNYVTCHMSYVKCLCWSLGHAEQFLFSCLCSNIAVYGCKRQCFFFDTTTSTLACESTNHRAGSQLKTVGYERQFCNSWPQQDVV